MSTKLSTALSNRASQTGAGTPNAPTDERGRLRVLQGTIALLTTDIEDDDIILLAAVPSNASVVRLEIANDDLETTTTLATANVGLYNDIAGAVAADADVYATLITQFQAAAGFTDVAFEARDINKTGQKVWQDAGLAADDNKEKFIGVAFVVGGNTAGDIAYRIQYVVD